MERDDERTSTVAGAGGLLPAARGRADASCGGLRSIALIGSHGPRPGGLATFTAELGDALTREWPALAHVVIAVNDRTRHQPLPASVRLGIAPADVSAYRRAADFLNIHDVDLVSVQYEDGLHGGPGGMYLLALLRELRMPVVTTFHTVTPAPDRVHRDVMNEIVRRSERLVVTSARGAQLLRELYGVRPENIDHIPGGGSLPSPAVARAYGRCFERARADHAQRHWHAEDTPTLADRILGVPPLELAHVSWLTDDAGIQSHGPREDACGDHLLDDNARALAVMAWLEQLGADDCWTVSVLASRYLAFVVDGFDGARGRFRARLDADGAWTAALASEDAHARALWALATVVGRARDRGRCHLAAECFRAALPACEAFTSPLAQAYTLLALSEYQRSYAGDQVVDALQRTLTARLTDELGRGGGSEWPWLEAQVGVESARVAQAALVAGDRLGDARAVALGARVLHWLLGGQRAATGGFVARTDAGTRADGPAPSIQRPADACAVISAALCALRITGEEQWADEASHAYAWFLGANSAQVPLYDPRTGACADGVVDDRLEPGAGAVAICAFLLASAELRAAVGGVVADQLPCDLRALARGTGAHARQVRAQLLTRRDDARADGHAVAPAHTDPDRES